jgi:hypothetical protein
MQRETVGLTVIAVRAVRLRGNRHRRSARDEGRQCIDIPRFGLHARLRPCFLRLGVTGLAFARLIILVVARHKWLCGRRDIGLRVVPAERRLDEGLAVVVALVEILFPGAAELLQSLPPPSTLRGWKFGFCRTAPAPPRSGGRGAAC